mmetsp:Transcript_20683/g.39326  ORF Transcript_20683/g.39326 Transcript_20683/m.39326 type:complete len:390 (+) Transcript_20683:147-1316(+)
MEQVDGPKGVVCTHEGDRCWYANDRTGEVCEVEMGEGNEQQQQHKPATISLVQPIDIETGEVITFQNNKGVRVYYPQFADPFCIKGILCPSAPGVPILLIADSRGSRIIAMDTRTSNAVVLVEWPDDGSLCNTHIEHMTLSYNPYPAIFATSYKHVERVSLVTGKSKTVHSYCEEDPDMMQHGLVFEEDRLYVTKGEDGVGRFPVVDPSTGKYVDNAGHENLHNLPVGRHNDWMDVLVLQSNPSHLVLLDRAQDEISVYRLTDGHVQSLSTGDGVYQSAHGFTWLNDHSDSLVVASTAKNGLAVVTLHHNDLMPGLNTSATVDRVIPLPEGSCPVRTKSRQRKPVRIVSSIAVFTITFVLVAFIWKRRSAKRAARYVYQVPGLAGRQFV